MRVTKLLVILLFVLSSASVQAAPETFTYQGTLTDASDAVLANTAESVTFSIYNPALNCLLYQETQAITTDANGAFSAQIGSAIASGKRTGSDPGLAMTKVFEGQAGVQVRSAGADCSAGYTAASGDKRYLRIKVGSTDLAPDLAISSVPFATTASNANAVGGYDSSYLFRSSTATSALSASAVTNLLFLGTPAACSNGQYAKWDGTTWTCGSVVAGTVTSVTAGTGLTGGTITGSGTIGLGTELSGLSLLSTTGVVKRTGTGAYSAANLAASDIPSLDWSKVTTGKPTSLSGYGILDGVQNLGGAVSLQSGVDASKSAAGTSGRIYFATDTSKIYRDNGSTWETIASNGAGGGITALTGDVTASGTGSVAASVAYVNGVTAVDISAGATLANNATDANAASKIVKRDSSGDFSARKANLEAAVLKGSTTGSLSHKVPASFSDYTLVWPSTAGISNQVLSTDGSGNLSWVTQPGGGLSAISNTASLDNGKIWIGDGTNKSQERIISGDAILSNTGVLTVTSVAGKSFSSTTPSMGQVLRSNGSQYAPAYLSITDIRSTVGGNAQFFPLNCTAGQTLTWNLGSDTMSCSNISISASQVVGAGDFMKDGSVAMTGSVKMGGQTIYGDSVSGGDLKLESTSSATKGDVLIAASGGNVGIGTSTPYEKVSVASTSSIPDGVSVVNSSMGTNAAAVFRVENDMMNSGYFGMGSTSHVNLLKRDRVYVEAGPGVGGLSLLANGSDISFGISGARYMQIDSTGKVGIGTTSANSTLDVNGGITARAVYEGFAPAPATNSTYTISSPDLSVRRFTLVNNTTITLPSFNPAGNSVYSLTVFVKQDATGGRTLNWSAPSATIKWESGTAPAHSMTGGTTTIFQFTKASDEAIWYGQVVWRED